MPHLLKLTTRTTAVTTETTAGPFPDSSNALDHRTTALIRTTTTNYPNRRVWFPYPVVDTVVEIPNVRDDPETKEAMFYSIIEIKAFIQMAKEERAMRKLGRKRKSRNFHDNHNQHASTTTPSSSTATTTTATKRRFLDTNKTSINMATNKSHTLFNHSKQLGAFQPFLTSKYDTRIDEAAALRRWMMMMMMMSTTTSNSTNTSNNKAIDPTLATSMIPSTSYHAIVTRQKMLVQEGVRCHEDGGLYWQSPSAPPAKRQRQCFVESSNYSSSGSSKSAFFPPRATFSTSAEASASSSGTTLACSQTALQ